MYLSLHWGWCIDLGDSGCLYNLCWLDFGQTCFSFGLKQFARLHTGTGRRFNFRFLHLNTTLKLVTSNSFIFLSLISRSGRVRWNFHRFEFWSYLIIYFLWTLSLALDLILRKHYKFGVGAVWIRRALRRNLQIFVALPVWFQWLMKSVDDIWILLSVARGT